MASLPLTSYVETSREPHSQPGERTYLLPSIQLNPGKYSTQVRSIYLPLIPSLWSKVGFCGERKGRVDWLVEGKATPKVPGRRHHRSQRDTAWRGAVAKKSGVAVCAKI